MKKVGKRIVSSAVDSSSEILKGNNPSKQLKRDAVKIARIAKEAVHSATKTPKKDLKTVKKIYKSKKRKVFRPPWYTSIYD